MHLVCVLMPGAHDIAFRHVGLRLPTFSVKGAVLAKDQSFHCQIHNPHLSIAGRTISESMRSDGSPCAQGPFSYEALPPEDIVFVPLKPSKEFDARSLLQVLT